MLNEVLNYPFDSSLGIQEALRFQGHESKSSSKFLEKVEGTMVLTIPMKFLLKYTNDIICFAVFDKNKKWFAIPVRVCLGIFFGM